MYGLRKLLRIYNGFIVPLFLTVLSIGVVVWGVMPGIDQIRTIIDESKQLSDENALVKKRVDLLNSLNQDTLQAQMRTLLSAVPSEKDLPTFFISMDALSQQSGITLNEFRIDDPGSISTPSAASVEEISPDSDNTTLRANITIAGTMDQIRDFLDRVITVRRLFRIAVMDLKFNQEDDIVEGSLNVNTFFAPLPLTLGKSTDTITPLSTDEDALLSKLETYSDVTVAASDQLDISNVQVGGRADPFTAGAPF